MDAASRTLIHKIATSSSSSSTPLSPSNTIFFFLYVRKIGKIGKLQNTIRMKGFVEDNNKDTYKFWYFFKVRLDLNVGRCSSVGIGTELRAGRSGDRIPMEVRFSALFQTEPGAHPASCAMGIGSFPGGKERPGRDADPSPPSSAVGHERVELYLYSPYGSYGLYRASVPVQECTLGFYLT